MAGTFGKDVAKEFRSIKEHYENSRPSAGPSNTTGVDKSVREQVVSDLDRLIEKNESAPA